MYFFWLKIACRCIPKRCCPELPCMPNQGGLPRCACASVHAPIPETQVCPNFKRLLLQQVDGPSATLIDIRLCHDSLLKASWRRARIARKNYIGDFHLSETATTAHEAPWGPPCACPFIGPHRGPLVGKSGSRQCNQNAVFLRKC